MKTILIILSFFHLSVCSYGQTELLFTELNNAQKLRLKNMYNEDLDSTLVYFNASIKKLFHANDICDKLPDTSNHYFLVNKLENTNEGQTLAYAFINNIVISTTDRFKIYSWDDLLGGSYHEYTNYLQYKNAKGECVSLKLDSSFNSHEVGYYNIEKVQNYYIVFGYGTYGGGQQHYIIRLFTYKNGELVEYSEGYPEGIAIMIFCARAQNINLKYNPANKTVSYTEFTSKTYDDGKFTTLSETVVYKIKNGHLIRKIAKSSKNQKKK